MAINAVFNSSKEIIVGVGLDASNVGAAFAGTFTSIETDSVTPPTFNDVRVERRGGATSGIMTSTADHFVYTPGATIEGSVSGFLTDELHAILIPAVTGVAISSSAYTVDGTTTSNVTFQHNDSSALNKTLTFAYNGVGGSGFEDCIAIPGCVVTSLTLTADPNEDGGRMKFDASWISRTPVAANAYSTTALTMGSYSTAYVFLGDYSVHSQIGDADVLLKSLSLTIENPVVFGGFGGNGTDGAPMTYVRSVPGFVVTANPIVKYDTTLDGLWDLSSAATTLASPAFEISDNADPSAGNRSFSITDGIITEIGWDEGDYLGLSLAIKGTGDTSTSLYIRHA